MLQIQNVEDGKSEWNINETHIIIPMIDVDHKESDRILTSTLTLNSLEGRGQGMLTSGLEHSLVIGLDKTLFEASNYKSDLVIIQNSDLKNSIAYTLSYVDQDKSEILWQTSGSRDRMSVSDKAILEVRDVLNYDMRELEKTEQINLGSLDSNTASPVTKTDSEILTNTMVPGKKEPQDVNYYSRSQGNEAVSILPQLDVTKFIESMKPVESNKVFENKSQSDKDSGYDSTKSTQRILSNATEPGIEINNSLLVELVDDVIVGQKANIFTNTKANDEKIGERKDKGVNSVLYEKSLPLKKKAKMKRTLILFNSENQKSLLKQDVITTDQLHVKFPNVRKVKESLLTNTHQKEHDPRNDPWNSDSDEPLINKITKRKKTKIKTDQKKCKKFNPKSPVLEEEYDSNKPITNSSAEDGDTDACEFDVNKFNNVYDLIECLRRCRIINTTIWQTLHSGLKEMKVDILKEMNTKKNYECSPENLNYSPQLKAFALVLYFKQPAAFNHLSHVYKTGWPSLNVIKEWKRRMNNHQRPNVVRMKRGSEALK